MKLKKKMSMMILLIFILLPQGILAGEFEGPPPGPPEDEEKKERIRENIETLRAWKLLEVLDLSQEQSTRFLPALNEFQKAKKGFEGKRRNLLKDLEFSLESEKREKALKVILDSLENNRKEFERSIDRFVENAKSILTLEQQAKLILFEEQFERKVRETIEQIRGRHRFRKF